MPPDKPIKLCLVCTTGGHFEQMTNLEDFYGQFDHFWITNKNKQTLSQLKNEKAYYIESAHFKEPVNYLKQVPEILRAFAIERPTHFLSTGSGRTAFIPYLLAKLLFKPFVHIDTFSIVHGYSKFGQFLLKVGEPILSQWEDPGNPQVSFIGPIFKNLEKIPVKPEHGHVFVTLGTRSEPFTRLVKAVENLVVKGIIREHVIVQAGHTRYASDHLEIFDYCTPDEIDAYIANARYVITQESAGIGTKCLKFKTPFIVMPRDYQYRELPAASDMNEDLHLKLEEIGYTQVVHTTNQLETAIKNLNSIKTGFVFDNRRAIRVLSGFIK